MSRVFEALTRPDLEEKRPVKKVFDADLEFTSSDENGLAPRWQLGSIAVHDYDGIFDPEQPRVSTP